MATDEDIFGFRGTKLGGPAFYPDSTLYQSPTQGDINKRYAAPTRVGLSPNSWLDRLDRQPAATQNAIRPASDDSMQGLPPLNVTATNYSSRRGQEDAIMATPRPGGFVSPQRSVSAETVGGWNAMAGEQYNSPNASPGIRSSEPLQTGLVNSQFNTMPSSSASGVDPATNWALSDAKRAAVGRGESLGGGTVGGYNDGGASAAVGALQEHLKGLDADARQAWDGTLAGNWKSKQLMRQRNAVATSGAQILGEQAALQNSGTNATRVGNDYDLGLRHDFTNQRGQNLNYAHGMAQVGAQRYNTDSVLGLGLVHDNTMRRNADLTLQGHMASVDAQMYGHRASLAPHLPRMQVESKGVQLLNEGNPDAAERMFQLTQPNYYRQTQDKAFPMHNTMGETTGIATMGPDGKYVNTPLKTAADLEKEKNAAASRRLVPTPGGGASGSWQ